MAHPDARLVVIDTYASVAPETRGVNRHQEDYNALAGLADVARRFPDVLFVLIHHTRKSEGEDVMQRISGSNGMTGATDGNACSSGTPPHGGACSTSARATPRRRRSFWNGTRRFAGTWSAMTSSHSSATDAAASSSTWST